MALNDGGKFENTKITPTKLLFYGSVYEKRKQENYSMEVDGAINI